jgi:predicted TPR repeat methyltransferase
VAEAVASLVTPAAALDVLDAGCGTGLVAPLVRPYARTLVGVDLSERMLALARGRGLYDDLVHAELTEYLGREGALYDLIASVDTLVYFGDLSEVTRGLAHALRPGGHIVFTVEKSESKAAPAGYRLNAHGRYSQSEDYLRGVLSDAGLVVLSVREVVLRLESKKPVAGFVVTATRALSGLEHPSV